jgi:hypothetical protein
LSAERDNVAGERIAGGGGWVPHYIAIRGKVAADFGRRGDVDDLRGLILLADSLIVEEEKRAVLPERAADAGAEQVVMQDGNFRGEKAAAPPPSGSLSGLPNSLCLRLSIPTRAHVWASPKHFNTKMY